MGRIAALAVVSSESQDNNAASVTQKVSIPQADRQVLLLEVELDCWRATRKGNSRNSHDRRSIQSFIMRGAGS